MTIVETEGRDVNSRTVQLVKLLGEIGPDVPEISRRLGQFKESVRYRYKEKILSKGFAVTAYADHERLGLQRLIVVLDFSEDYRKYGQAILASMNELCFLVSFSKAMPRGYYVVNFSAPQDMIPDLKEFLMELKDKGMFSQLEILDFDWIRLVPMKPEFYDFDTGIWDFDWSKPSNEEYTSAKYLPSTPSKFDQVDLLVVKELQMDANKSLKDISDNLNINYKKLAWHYTTHVLGRGLIRGYAVNWMGTRYDYVAEKVLHRQHRYFGVELIAKNVSEYEVMSLRHAMDRLPYLWAEAVGKNYFAQFAFPVDFVVEGLQYITQAIAPIKERTEIFAIDQTDSARFTIPYARFDGATKKWNFDGVGLGRRFDELILKIKNGTG